MGATRGSLLTALGVVAWMFFRVETEIELRLVQIPVNDYGRMALGALMAGLIVWGALDIRRDPQVRGGMRVMPLAGALFVVAALAARIGGEILGGQPKAELDATLVSAVGFEPILLILGAALVMWPVGTGFDRGVMTTSLLLTGIGAYYALHAAEGLIDGPTRWAQYNGRVHFFMAVAAGPLALVAALIGSRDSQASREQRAAPASTPPVAVSVPVKGPTPQKPAR